MYIHVHVMRQPILAQKLKETSMISEPRLLRGSGEAVYGMKPFTSYCATNLTYLKYYLFSILATYYISLGNHTLGQVEGGSDSGQ